MKKIIVSIAAILSLSMYSFGQAPEGFKYQAVLRDAGNTILNNQAVGVKMSILQGSASGTLIYTETFSITTNGFGLINLEIGTGTTTDIFSTIDWANGPFFMETATDLAGGTTYELMGVSQLMSVPYALYAKTSGSSIPGPQGAQGISGVDGSNGIAGVDGATGATGAQGSAGPTGATGSAGIDGSDGATGLTGAQGATGPIGTTGATGTQGSTGTTGSTGPAGATGATGSAGIDGSDGATGATGTTGAAGIDGVDGATGSTGAQGATGSAGATGTTGSTGTQGATGPNGTTGAAGIDGSDGATGTTGATGPAGPAGATGSAGPTGATGLLSNGTNAGDAPYWNGTSWVVNSSPDFGYYTFAANGTYTNLSLSVGWPSNVYQRGLSTTGMAVTLKANKLYAINASLYAYNFNENSYYQFGFYNATALVNLGDQVSWGALNGSTAAKIANYTTQPIVFMFRPTVDTQLELKITNVYPSGSILPAIYGKVNIIEVR